MTDLPAQPDLNQLRHQARDLLRAARAGDAAAAARIRAVSERMTLMAAQLAVAREYGFASWTKLKAEVDARTTDLARKVDAFLEASIRGGPAAVRLLAATPEIAGYDFRTAVVLGDASRVRELLGRDPGLATRPDPRTGWTALHAVCGSRWHLLDPARADGLVATARLLLDAGADLRAGVAGSRRRFGAGWSPMGCATASASTSASNQPLIGLLLERGAVPGDGDLLMAGFARDARQCLRLLLDHMPDVAGTARTALSAPISTGDSEAVRMLLEAGADPRRYADDDGRPRPAAYDAVASGCPAELLELLLGHGADPDAAGPDGRSPYRLATTLGRSDLAALLRRHGARDNATSADRFLAACLRADEASARAELARDPGLVRQLTEAEHATIGRAAQAGSTAAVALMLDLGFPIEVRLRGDDGATPLHVAAYCGSAGVVRLLLDRGADIEARDTTFRSTPLGWAIVGSGERPEPNPDPDWIATVRTLIEAGASAADVTLSPDDSKPPSPDVAELLRGYGIGGHVREGG